MPWVSIRNCGKTKEFYKNILLNAGKIKTGEFFKEIMGEFAKVSTRTFDTTGDITFSYKERQLSSIFLPSFYNLGYGAVQEVPTRRKERGEDCSHGWLDYWVQKDDNWVYLIELKHGWQYYDGRITKDTHEKIAASVNQLKCIRKGEIKKLSFVENTYKVSFLVLPIWRNIPKDYGVKEDEECPTAIPELDGMAKSLAKSLPKDVSWMGVWSLPERMQFVFQFKKNVTLRTFPGVVLLATVV